MNPLISSSSASFDTSFASNSLGGAESCQNTGLIRYASAPSILPSHQNWHLNHALLTRYSQHADRGTQARIQHLALNAFGKASSISKIDSVSLGIQTSPISQQDMLYHRSVRNILLSRVHLAYEGKMGIPFEEFYLVDSPLLKEILSRENPQQGIALDVESLADFCRLIDNLLLRAESGIFPEESTRVLIDISKYIACKSTDIKDLCLIANQLERIVFKKLEQLQKGFPEERAAEIGDKLLSKLQLIAFTTYQEEDVLLIPRFLKVSLLEESPIKNFLTYKVSSKHGNFYGDVRETLARTGFLLSPDQAKKAWLKIASLSEIMETLNLPSSTLQTPPSPPKKDFQRWDSFLREPIVAKFRALKDEDIPYLTIYPEATYLLLKGLESQKIDRNYSQKQLSDLLQVSYFRILNAMQEAVFKKHDLIAFNNQIEVVHQEIQNILGIIEPYDESEYSKVVTQKMHTGKNPVIPPELSLKVHVKPSAMHSLASILAGIEAEKGPVPLNVLISERCYYYEISNALTKAKTHQLSILKSSQLDEGRIETGAPIDLFVCEFHHNILYNEKSYRKEPVLEQVKEMFDKNLVAEKITVIIDNTVDLEDSDDARAFFADQKIQALIQSGKLNVVLIRSAQKFDMIGIDNYYGGITLTVNNPAHHAKFNQRMDHKGDQLKGLSYQGLTHIQKNSSNYLDRFRQAVMENTQKLYKMLPEASIYQPESKNPMQISQINDDKIFFLDIKFPGCPNTMEAFQKAFTHFARAKGLPLTSRTSFSFINSSLTSIRVKEGEKLRLNLGLEGEKMLQQYADFFQLVQNQLSEKKSRKIFSPISSSNGFKNKDSDALFAERLNAMKF